MARTIAEIKDGIAGDFMRNEDVARAYGFEVGDSFTAHFSKASVESVLFYIFACAAWVVESLFDEHRREVNLCIEEILPHRPKWYRDKVLGFMKNKVLIADTDRYDTEGMSEDDIMTLVGDKVKEVLADLPLTDSTIDLNFEKDGNTWEPTAGASSALSSVFFQ